MNQFQDNNCNNFHQNDFDVDSFFVGASKSCRFSSVIRLRRLGRNKSYDSYGGRSTL